MMAPKKPKQAAAVCYKLVNKKPEFLLVQARSSKDRWIFPKGKIKVEISEKPWTAAAREAEEEAGVKGQIRRKSLAKFRLYGSEIDAYLLEVKTEGPPQEEDRAQGWFRRYKAIRMLAQNRGGKSIVKLTAVLNAAWHEVSPKGRNQVVLSYSSKDKKWLDKLNVVLKPLANSTKIRVWDDTKIKPGERWKREIREALATAKIAVLLVSPHFLASDFITQHELPVLLRAAKQKHLSLMWIAVRPCGAHREKFSKYQAVNDPSKPLASYKKAELYDELEAIRQKIEEVLDKG